MIAHTKAARYIYYISFPDFHIRLKAGQEFLRTPASWVMTPWRIVIKQLAAHYLRQYESWMLHMSNVIKPGYLSESTPTLKTRLA